MFEFIEFITLRTVFLAFHIIGAIVAAGAAFFTDIIFFAATKDGKVTKDEYSLLSRASTLVWVGLFLAIPSGVGLFTLAPALYLANATFLAKVTILVILLANGIFFHVYHLPHIKKFLGRKVFTEESTIEHNTHLAISGVISVTSWIFIVALGAMINVPFGFGLIMLVYVAVLLIGSLLALKVATPILSRLDRKKLKKDALLLALLLLIVAIGVGRASSPLKIDRYAVDDATQVPVDELPTFSTSEVSHHNTPDDCWVFINEGVYDVSNVGAGLAPLMNHCGDDALSSYKDLAHEETLLALTPLRVGNVALVESDEFTMADVAAHGTADDCWMVIDGLVFDMTEASRFHPARFPNCGGDATENYFKNHAPSKVIRDKQMAFHIGTLVVDGVPQTKDDVAIIGPRIHEECEVDDRPGDPTNPRTELFVDPGSWDTHDIMAIIEKHCRSLLFIDGTTHGVIGRIHDIGHQMHAPTFSRDGKFMYIIARDGFVSKVDLETLETLKTVRIGNDSRGTGLTEDGKYLLVGNFDPHTAVLLDTETLETLKTYETSGPVHGEVVSSRVGGIAQLGSKLYVVIKDANAVWVIDTAKEGFPVTDKYERLGDGTPPLHDIYLTPDGDYLIAAVQDAAVAWVLNTRTGEVVAEVPTGKTPHTGPGATVDNLTFVPTLDPEGILSVIDTTTWENVRDIKVGGPALFIRHNPRAETAEEYKYVWGETAFGDFHDEIYIIDVTLVETDKNPIVYTLKPVPGESSWHPEFTRDGKFVYVVSMTGDQVVVYDAETFEVVARIRSGTPSSVVNVGNRTEEFGL